MLSYWVMDTLPFCVQVGVLENGTPAETDQAILETAAIRKINAQAERKTFFRVDFEFVIADSLFLIFFCKKSPEFFTTGHFSGYFYYIRYKREIQGVFL